MKSVLRITTITFTLILSFTINLATAQTPQDIAKDARVSTVSVMMDNNNYGSGFFVTPNHIATSYHVIEGAKSGYVSPIFQTEKFDIVGIVAADKENDLVILKVFGVVGNPLPIGESKTVDVLDKVIVVGNPAGIEGTVTTDTINNILPGSKYFLMSASISPGSSGGAVLNDKGEVIGVTMATIPGDKNQNQSLNLAVPSNYLTPLVEKAKKSEKIKPLSTDGVSGYRLTWGDNFYAFSLRNQRREDIEVEVCMVIFYGKNDELICVDIFHLAGLFMSGFVSAGGAIRIQREFLPLDSGEIQGRYAEMWKEHYITFIPSSIKPLVKRTEVRILDSNIIPNYDPPPKKGITGGKFRWTIPIEIHEALDTKGTTRFKSASYHYDFHLYNSLDKVVKNVEGLIIFYDDKEVPIHSNYFSKYGPPNRLNVGIPAGETETVSGSVGYNSVRQLTKRVEIKIRSFETVE